MIKMGECKNLVAISNVSRTIQSGGVKGEE
jgi:hypothetical protein